MCFSNLPVEFDEDGNPYLADEAEDVDRPGEDVERSGDHEHAVVDGHGTGTEHGVDCGCATGDAATAGLATDPEGAYEDILAVLPDGARDQVAGDRPDPTSDTEPAESD